MNIEEYEILYLTIPSFIYALIQYIIYKKLIYLRLYNELNSKKIMKCIFSFKDYFEFDNKLIFKANHPKYKQGDIFTGAVWIMYWLSLYNISLKNIKLVLIFMCLGTIMGLLRTQRVVFYNLKDKIKIYDYSLINIFKDEKKEFAIKNSKLKLEKILRRHKLYEFQVHGSIRIYLISIIVEGKSKLELTFQRHKKNKSYKLAKKICKGLNLPFIDMRDKIKKI